MFLAHLLVVLVFLVHDLEDLTERGNRIKERKKEEGEKEKMKEGKKREKQKEERKREGECG